MEKIGRKKQISLKTIFPDGSRGGEAHDWTPSLFNNEQGILDDLMEITGISIDPTDMEYYVWDKSRIDILGINEDTGNKVIIENQFGDADDSHFSRILKYRAGIDKLGDKVDTIIWITEGADDAFIEVIRDWNDHYNDVNFFLIKMCAEEDINTKTKYVYYDTIVKPNNFVKDAEIIKNSSNNEQLYIEFWKLFREKFLQSNLNINALKKDSICKYKEKWCISPWQINGEHMTHYIGLKTTNKKLQILYGNGRDNEYSFDSLNDKLNIWGKYIIVSENTSKEYDICNKNQWNEMIDWFIDNVMTTKKLIDEINKNI